MAGKTGRPSEAKNSYKNYTGNYKPYSGTGSRNPASSGKTSAGSSYKNRSSSAGSSYKSKPSSAGSSYKSKSSSAGSSYKTKSSSAGSSYKTKPSSAGSSYKSKSSAAESSYKSRSSAAESSYKSKSSSTGSSYKSKSSAGGTGYKSKASAGSSSYKSRTSAAGGTYKSRAASSGTYKSKASSSGAGYKNRTSPDSVRGRKRRSVSEDNFLILKLLILVCLVIVVFEGRMILTMFSGNSSREIRTSSATDLKENETESIPSEGEPMILPSQLPSSSGASGNGGVAGLAGLAASEGSSSPGSGSSPGNTVSGDGSISESIDSFAVVPYTEPAIDDSYFRDAVFIGDSRMEGFRNTSGITQGTFMTSVGMSLSSIADAKVNTSDGEITVYQGLSGRQYGKIYLMLGTNDLGYYPWEEFQGHAEEVLEQFHKLQPGAVIYVCGVIYVEGQKISTDYVNNENVRKVNGYLLNACEDLSYCYYLNLNEIFSNGYGALIDGATADGVHLQPQYSSMMLDYLKTHYVTWDDAGEADEPQQTEDS